MLITAIVFIIVGLILLILGKKTSQQRSGKKQSFISFGVVCLVLGVFALFGQIINITLDK